MHAFVWNARFETGIPRIDAQHRRLVDLVNALGDVLVGDAAVQLDEVFAQLQDYVQVHFTDEESLMTEHGLDVRFIARHRELHEDFKHQLAGMRGINSLSRERVEDLHEFLSAWLVVHILGEDHAYARLIHAGGRGAAGVAALDAGTMVPSEQGDGERILLFAVRRLYRALSKSNAELMDANLRLEEKVSKRTRELVRSNEALKAEREQLQHALGRIEAAQKQLVEQEKMASVGQLAAGVAHEINNPIGFVTSNLGSLSEYVQDLLTIVDLYESAEPLIARDPQVLRGIQRRCEECDLAFVRADVGKLLDESRNGLLRVKHIVEHLRELSHPDPVGWQLADVHAGLDSTLAVVASELRQKAEVRRDYGDLPRIWCNSAQLNQVFLNLLVNAAQAIDEHGLITIRTGREDAEGEAAWGWVDIEDNGCGIPTEHLGKVFEPFFTTKPVGKGTGLGLSVSWGIVQQHGGTIEVSSEPGHGTRFRIRLPLAAGEDANA